jgi:hypothetical protein
MDGALHTGIGVEQVFDESGLRGKTSRGLPTRCQFFAWPGVNALGNRVERIGALDEQGNVYPDAVIPIPMAPGETVILREKR